MTAMRFALMILFTACTSDPPPDSELDTEAAYVVPTSCEFEDIAGTWGRTEAIPQAPGFTHEVEIASGEDGESIGSTLLYADDGPLCTFDMTCGLSEVEGYHYAYNTIVESNAGCTAGGYHMRLDGIQLEVIYNLLDSPGRLGNQTFVFDRDF